MEHIIDTIFRTILNAGIVLGMLAFCLFSVVCAAAIVRVAMDALKWIFS